MKIGTRSILFGVHQFAVHPWFVAWAWWKLYGFPWDLRLWVAFFVHDLGYLGKPNMDGPEGERHVELGAAIMHWLFDRPRIITVSNRLFGFHREHNYRWLHFCLFHSRFYARTVGQPPSKLCAADKLAIGLTPWWLYLPQAWLTGELREYMKGEGARTPAGDRSAFRWYQDVQAYCTDWAFTHKDGRKDTWTGTVRDLAFSRKEVEHGDAGRDES